MNNYLKLLLHLKHFEGDGKMHPIEDLFPELTLDEKKNIFNELVEENFIILSGREERYLSFMVEKNILTGETNMIENPMNEHILHSEPDKYKAKITFKGSKYLKEELEMQEKGKYNINVTGSGANNTFVIESNNVTIDNKPDFSKKIEKIIETIKSDNAIDEELKAKAISDFQNAKIEVNKSGKLHEKIVKSILQYGAQIGSIGSLLYQLFAAT
jgi:hypothetical protein